MYFFHMVSSYPNNNVYIGHCFPFKPLLWHSKFSNVGGLFPDFYSMLVCLSMCIFKLLSLCNKFQNQGGLVLPYYSTFQSVFTFPIFLNIYTLESASSFNQGYVCICIHIHICHITQIKTLCFYIVIRLIYKLKRILIFITFMSLSVQGHGMSISFA